ncbi:GL12766 [Drosophila persimilis]|uniref:GL12766 n=1 Tax=Drosophila persimilis TaxID=7234 RepID=B4H7P8_DROPE|nr:GL12766 [Drosophila persimilis]
MLPLPLPLKMSPTLQVFSVFICISLANSNTSGYKWHNKFVQSYQSTSKHQTRPERHTTRHHTWNDNEGHKIMIEPLLLLLLPAALLLRW